MAPQTATAARAICQGRRHMLHAHLAQKWCARTARLHATLMKARASRGPPYRDGGLSGHTASEAMDKFPPTRHTTSHEWWPHWLSMAPHRSASTPRAWKDI